MMWFTSLRVKGEGHPLIRPSATFSLKGEGTGCELKSPLSLRVLRERGL
jgi:hypothetical protein